MQKNDVKGFFFYIMWKYKIIDIFNWDNRDEK